MSLLHLIEVVEVALCNFSNWNIIDVEVIASYEVKKDTQRCLDPFELGLVNVVPRIDLRSRRG